MKGAYLYAQDGIILGKSADKNQPFAQAGREYCDGKAACRGSILETSMESLLAGTIKVHIQWKQTVRELLLSKMIGKSSLATISTQHKVEASLHLCKLIRVQSLQPISGAEFRNRRSE